MQKLSEASGYETDKLQNRHYLRQYERFFEPLRERPVHLLELGVYGGGSLRLWHDYFPKGIIAGLDAVPLQQDDLPERIAVYTGLQQDIDLLDRIRAEVAPDGFDIIIDDCSHVGELTAISFWHLFERHLKPGGLYVIEDWGTGYWGRFRDGKRYAEPPRTGNVPRLQRMLSAVSRAGFVKNSVLLRKVMRQAGVHLARRRFPNHSYGVVGFIKQLVDECGMYAITHPEYGNPPRRMSKIARMEISHGQVVIVKAEPDA